MPAERIFDPDVVAAFNCRIEDFRAIAARYEDVETADLAA